MIVHRGRLLPSVIVGALVTASLTLGAGVASAAPRTCRSSDGVDFVVSGTVSLLAGTVCSLDDLLEATADELTAAGLQTLAQYQAALDEAPGGNESAGGGSGTPIMPLPDLTGDNTPTSDPAPSTEADGSSAGGESGPAPGAGGGSGAGPASGGPAQGVAPASALPAPDVRGVVAAPALAAPGGLAAGVPALTIGRPNPALFAPLGSPLRTLTGVSPGSPVTTSSDVQAMAFDDLPGGMGTPAVVGVLILSTLGAFALRHRILRRARSD